MLKNITVPLFSQEAFLYDPLVDIKLFPFNLFTCRSPGWRPTFKYYNRWLSLLGTFICLAVMFLMDYRTAIATYIIILLLYILIHTRNPEANWGSSAQSLTFLSALRSVQTLEKVDDHVKNYRPKVFLTKNVDFISFTLGQTITDNNNRMITIDV